MNSHSSYTLVSRSDADRLLRRRSLLTTDTLAVTAFLADLIAIVALAVATGLLYHELAYGEPGVIASYLQIGGLTASMFVTANLFRGEYKLTNYLSFRRHLGRTLRLWNATFIALLALGFLLKISVVFSRGWILLLYSCGLCVVLLLRYLLVQVVKRATRVGLISTKRIFLIGTGRKVAEFIHHHEPWKVGARIVGCRFLTPAPPEATREERRALIERDLDDALQSARDLEPDAVFIAAPWSETATVDRIVERLLSLPVEIHLAPERVLYRFDNAQLARLGSMSSLQLTRPPLSRLEVLEKRLLDILAASVALVLFTPALLVIAAMIKLDSRGPVFFLQRRFGFNQKPFRIIKFRTMRTLDDGAVIRQATRDDPRVTRIGRWLRRWNIDEVPQLFNVLKGDMSLVGPRPHALSHDHEFQQKIARYARRHNVKPGITGWAQLHGLRGETDTDDKMRKRVEYDLYYIDNWSLGFDLRIMLQTVISPAAYRNAY